MAADNNGYSSKESWKRSGAGKSPGDKLEGEGGSSGQPACATAAVGYKPEPLPPETLTYHLSPALNDLPNNSAWEIYKPEQVICIIYSNFLEFQMLITIHLHLIQFNSR